MGHAREVAGIALIAIGAIGCVLPVLPGIPIIAAGVVLLGSNHPVVKRGRAILDRFRPRPR